MSQIKFEAEVESDVRLSLQDDSVTLGDLCNENDELKVFYQNLGVQISQKTGYMIAYAGPVVVTSGLLAYREQIFETTEPLLFV